MNVVRGLLVILHLVGMASIVGAWLSTLRTPRILPGMVHGALLQLVTGLLLVGLLESGAFGEDEAVDNAKIGLKLLITLVVAGLAWVHRRRADEVSPAVFHAVGGLALLNVAIAVLW
jgi:hypothetical protein